MVKRKKTTKKVAKKKPLTRRQVARKHGFRSGLEEDIMGYLESKKIDHSYESEKIEYVQPEVHRKYTPDFVLIKRKGGKMYLESKGRWEKSDRAKFDWIFEQYPDLDLRFIFQNPNAKLYKGSKTTYSQYCDKKGWKWAKLTVPDEWLKECSEI